MTSHPPKAAHLTAPSARADVSGVPGLSGGGILSSAWRNVNRTVPGRAEPATAFSGRTLSMDADGWKLTPDNTSTPEGSNPSALTNYPSAGAGAPAALLHGRVASQTRHCVTAGETAPHFPVPVLASESVPKIPRTSGTAWLTGKEPREGTSVPTLPQAPSSGAGTLAAGDSFAGVTCTCHGVTGVMRSARGWTCMGCGREKV